MTQPDVIGTLSAEVGMPVMEAEARAAVEEVDLSDAPELQPLWEMPYKRRAEVMRVFKIVIPQVEALQELIDASAGQGITDFEAIAQMYEALAGIEQIMELVVRDRHAWDAWTGKLDQNKLMALFNKYMLEFQTPQA